MPWFRIDDRAAFNAKVIAAGNEAYGAWVRAGAWSSGSQTPSRIPRATALTIAKQRVWDRLVDVGLMHSIGDDGWEIHDFFDFNPRPDETEERRAAVSAARAEAGRRGGLRSGETRRLALIGDDVSPETKRRARADVALAIKSGRLVRAPCESCGEEAEAHHDDYSRPLEVRWLCPNHHRAHHRNEAIASKQSEQNEAPIPIPIPIPIPNQINLGIGSDRGKPGRRGKTGKTPLPADFAVTAAIEAMCRAEGLPDPHRVLRDFRDKARMNEYRYADWEAAFRTWMRSPITRRDYPVWELPDEPEPARSYGPPAPPPPGLLERMVKLSEPTSPLVREAGGFVATMPAKPPIDELETAS